MKINFTDKEYRILIDLLEMADWLLHAHRIEIPPETKPYRDIIQKIFSYSKQMGTEHLVKYDPNLGGYFPTKEYEDTSDHMKYVKEFQNDSFWDELIHRLAERDLLNQKGIEDVNSMSFEDWIRAIQELEDWYSNEFSESGLDNLEVEIKSNRDREKPHGSPPPTPPYIRVTYTAVRLFRSVSRTVV